MSNPMQTLRVVVQCGQHLLLCQRPGTDAWEPIGGALEDAAHPSYDASTVIRRYTGMTFTADQFVPVGDLDFRYGAPANPVFRHETIFLLPITSLFGEVESERLTARWFGPGQLPELLRSCREWLPSVRRGFAVTGSITHNHNGQSLVQADIRLIYPAGRYSNGGTP